MNSRTWINHHWRGALVSLLFVATSALYMQQSYQLHNQTQALSRVTSCQEVYNNLFIASVAERAKASNIDRQASIDERKAQEVFITTLLNNPTDTVAARAALVKYKAAIAQVDEEQGLADSTRAENPLPGGNCTALLNDPPRSPK